MYFPRQKETFRRLLESLQNKRVAVLGHVRPDGDCLGSQVALTRVLRERGVDAVCVNRHPPPRTLEPFVGDTPWILAENFSAETAGKHVPVAVDCAGAGRVGVRLAEQYPAIAANIDHHRSNPLYAQVNIVEAESAATAEILAGLFFDLDIPIDPSTAQALYIGIATDTGQFRYATTTRTVFEIAARLMEQGASPATASAHLYSSESPAKIELLRSFLNSLTFDFGGRVCRGELPLSAFEKAGAAREDAEGFVDYARDIEEVEVGVLLEEYAPARLKGSLRAKDEAVRVDLLAAEFGGGGHACAAGFNQDSSIADFRPILRKRLAEHLRRTE